jgi:hypothetical protein
MDADCYDDLPSCSHINELPIQISKSVIARLQSIKHLQSQEEIDSWHEFCAAQTEPAVKSE